MSSTNRFVLTVLLAASAACRGEGPRAGVEIAEPVDGAQLAEPSVKVVLAASGIEIAPASEERPGTGHHHLFVDRDPVPPGDTIPQGVTGIIHLGRAQTEFTLENLAPGEHRVIAVLANFAHVALDPPAVDTVRFTVR
ncbi:MAG: DUF4399 domain-containing protein [Gemmatimonadota bacterium]|jgi:hypothetical protein